MGRAAALSGGKVADGLVDLTFGVAGGTFVLGKHSAYRLNASTLEPVARRGDILIVREMGEPSSRSLVIAKSEEKVVARRFEIAGNHSDVAVLTAQTINPRKIAPPIVVKKATLALHKIIGVLFDTAGSMGSGDDEVCDCGGEAILRRYAADIHGLVEVSGDSAEPIALTDQFLLIGSPLSAGDAMTLLEGRPVIASDGNDRRYFKRLRRGVNDVVVLESLEISGDYGPVMLTHNTGAASDIAQVWPVLGVLFERP
jgi:hypothetical protein